MKEGDIIKIDLQARTLDLDVPAETVRQRLSAVKQPEPRYTEGVFAKYAALVSSAAEGAVTSRPTLR